MGKKGGGYGKKDAARDTGSSGRDTSRAWHDARNDGAREGGRWSPGGRGVKSDSAKSGRGKSGSGKK